MLDVLYTIIIWPIQILFEFIFAVSNFLFKGNVIFSILSLSLFVNVLTLPLYRKADKLQVENKKKQLAMEPMISHIKNTFIGDERFMMLQTYYRQNNYKPFYALKGSISLILQIPFFMAAYNFLSNLPTLSGVSLGPIMDLGKNDSLFLVNGFSINVLPIIMTVINIISGAIYTKGQPLKARIQLYGIATVFLIILYNSPSGLVLYWIFNNIMSLIKNIVDKLMAEKQEIIKQLIDKCDTQSKKENGKNDGLIFLLGILFLTLYTGCYIPASIIKSSPIEFVNYWNISNPLTNVLYSGLLAFGTFIVWCGMYYLLSEVNVRRFISEIVFFVIIGGVFNYIFLGSKLGLINSSLEYDNDSIMLDGREKIVNAILMIIIAIILHVIYKKVKKIIEGFLIIGIVTVLFFSISYGYQINSEYFRYVDTRSMTYNDELSIPISKNGKNTIILMLDKAIGTQFPYILNEKPELISSFDGFTFYKNTISFGPSTVYGAPAVFGGYEYTPDEINARNDETLAKKTNEAFSVLPILFEENGYVVTICDPPETGSLSDEDLLDYYEEYSNINVLNTKGKYNTISKEFDERTMYLRKRNFFCNSIMRISPLLLWGKIYDHGSYNTFMVEQYIKTKSTAYGYRELFLDAYSTLENMQYICEVSDDNKNTFLMMTNDTPHDPTLLQEPEYIPKIDVDNTQYDVDMSERYTIDGITMNMEDISQVTYYHVNMAAILKVAEWLDWMKENDVYDNTRIIIVGDHGFGLNQFDLLTEDGTDIQNFIPLLLMKDFDSHGFSVSNDFMTNADGFYFAINGIIDNPINPFTNNPLNDNKKFNNQINIIYNENRMQDMQNYCYDKSKWYTVDENIYEKNNWTYIGEY